MAVFPLGCSDLPLCVLHPVSADWSMPRLSSEDLLPGSRADGQGKAEAEQMMPSWSLWAASGEGSVLVG